MADNVLFDNVPPATLTAVSTGNVDADAAIVALQSFPMSPHTPQPLPHGDEYEALVARAESVGSEQLLVLLDDAAITTGQSRWSDDHVDSLTTKDRRKFKKHYDQVLKALAIRKAYLHWLVAAVCNTPTGLERVVQVLLHGSADARLVAASSVHTALDDDDSKQQIADALDLRQWDGENDNLALVYRTGVVMASHLDPAAAFDRYADLLRKPRDDDDARISALLQGLVKATNPDPRWAPFVLPYLTHRMHVNQVAMVLKHLPADPSWVEPLCSVLPAPSNTKGFWNRELVGALSRAADTRALPWLVAALRASWMTWPAVFEAFRKVGDPAMAHVIRDWLTKHNAPDRAEVGGKVIAELERDGKAPAADPDSLAAAPTPARQRPVLKYARTAAFKKPKLDTLTKLTKVYGKAFEDVGLQEYFERIAKRAVWMIPKRVNETKLELGVTKLGGHPDLPARTKWPRFRRDPLTFLAQIDLAEVAPSLPKGLLPRAGLLSFFIGNDPDGKAGYCEKTKVIFTKPRAKLRRHEVPEDFYDEIFQAATVRLHSTLRLPSPTNRQLTKLLKGSKLDAYESEVYDSTAPVLPQLLGYRDHGYDAQEPATSELLLQLPGDSQTEMEFGDVDVLGMYIHRKKLAAGDFAKIWPHLGD